MENVNYGRVSTTEQNTARQLTNGYKSFMDTCSGTVRFFDRPKAKELMKHLAKNLNTTINILSIDRLGRDTIDILTTLRWFEEHKILIKITDLGMDSTSPFFNTMVGLLGTLAEHERKGIVERTQQGREIAKSLGKFEGRKKGTTNSRAKNLLIHSDIVTCLNQNMKIKDIHRVTGKARTTIYKIKDLL